MEDEDSLIGLAYRFQSAIANADPTDVVGQDRLVILLRSVGKQIRALLRDVQTRDLPRASRAPRARPAGATGKLTKM
mgnify:FL=1|jgi:hypothetical protein